LIARFLCWASESETLGLDPDGDSLKAGLRNKITNKNPRRKKSRHAAAKKEKARFLMNNSKKEVENEESLT
jgi:hypothetical protein